MHILLDMQGAQNGSRHRGIGRYTVSFAEALGRLASPNHRISLLLNGAFDNCDQVAEIYSSYVCVNDVHIWKPTGDPSYRSHANNSRRAASEYLREAVIHEIDPDVVILSSVIEGCDDSSVTTIKKFIDSVPTAAIFYDAIPYIYADDYLADPRAREWYFDKITELKRADLLLAISESSAGECIKYVGARKENVVNISTALSHIFPLTRLHQAEEKRILEKFKIQRNYILYAGASDSRKNLHALIQSYANLPKSILAKYQLVLAGGMPQLDAHNLRETIEKLDIAQDSVLMTDWISDHELSFIYHNADLFVFPSYHEGFGLPILEAMNAGIPVIGSRTSSIPEIIGLDEALFDPRSLRSMTETMQRGLVDEAFRERLIANGEQRRTLFSWDATAQVALSEIEQRFGKRSDSRVSMSETLHVRTVNSLLDSDIKSFPAIELAGILDSSLPKTQRRARIYLDVSELHVRDGRTGIQRVVKGILQNLRSAVGGEYDLFPLFTNLEREYKISHKIGSKYVEDYCIIDTIDPEFGSNDIFLGLDFHDVIVPFRKPFFDRIKGLGCKVYFVVYDLLPLQIGQFFSIEVRKNYENWLKFVSSYDGLICISKAVAGEVSEWARSGPIERSTSLPIGTFVLGSDLAPPSSDVLSEAVRDAIAQTDGIPVFLSVGTIEPRKRQDQILGAFDLLWEEGFRGVLILVGRRGWLTDDLITRLTKHPLKNQRFYWFEQAGDADLNALFDHSTALIAASEGEGFGLPLVEASAHELPVIARDIPVFREVLADSGYYFQGADGSALAMAIQNWSKLHESGAKAIASSIGIIDWSESARQVARLMFDGDWDFEVSPAAGVR